MSDAITSTSPDERSHYLNMPASYRVAVASEMTAEILDHYDHAESLVAALVTELRSTPPDPKAARHLATMVESWLMDRDHVSQKARLIACLEAIKETTHG